MSARKHKSVTGLLAAAALVVGAAAGVGGASLAAWKDQATATVAPIKVGVQVFAAGPAETGYMTPAPDLSLSTGSVNLTVAGPSLATALIASVNDPTATIKGATRAFVVTSVSQGNKGLSYTATAPTWSTGALASPRVRTEFFQVSSAAACTLTAPVTITPQPVEAVSPAYSSDFAVDYDFWCLRVIDTAPDAGAYENTVSAEGTGPQGTVTASPATPGTGGQPGSNVWKAIVTTALTAAGTPNATTTFTYTTARPVS